MGRLFWLNSLWMWITIYRMDQDESLKGLN
jgi:hypothetical protein